MTDSEVMGSMEEIQKVQSSMDPCTIPNIQYARGFIERDLKPDSLWTQSTDAKKARVAEEPSRGTSSSSSGPPTAAYGSDGHELPPLEYMRTAEMISLAKFFLGPPSDLLRVCPAAKHSSKMMGLPNPQQYLPKPPPPPPPKSGGAVLKWVRDPRWDLEGDSDFSPASGSDID